MSNIEKHALLSPSSSSRWLACTPSALLEAQEPFRGSSVYAEEGTAAHYLAELKLSYMLNKISVAEYDTRFEHFVLHTPYYNAEFNEFVNDYCKEVMTIIKEDYANEKVEVFLEERVEFTDVVPEGSGTSDVLIVGKNFIHVIDLKFGKGVAVSAIGNPQLRLYALGGLKKCRLNGVFTEAKMTIIQPRLYDISTDHVSVVELYEWAKNFVKPRADLAIKGAGELVPGDHCKFCKIKGKCEALGKAQLQAAQQEFELVVVDNNILEPRNMTPEMFSRILTIAPKFIDWFKDVSAYATASMINEGLKVPGYKVVAGRSQRVLTDQAAIAEILRTKGFAEEDYLAPRKLVGIGELEKNVGKKLFNELAANYIIKPEGKPTIALESDNRNALDLSQYKLVGQEFEDDYID